MGGMQGIFAVLAFVAIVAAKDFVFLDKGTFTNSSLPNPYHCNDSQSVTWSAALTQCSNVSASLCTAAEWCPAGESGLPVTGNTFAARYWVPTYDRFNNDSNNEPTNNWYNVASGSSMCREYRDVEETAAPWGNNSTCEERGIVACCRSDNFIGHSLMHHDTNDASDAIHFVNIAQPIPLNTTIVKWRWFSASQSTFFLCVYRPLGNNTYTVVAELSVTSSTTPNMVNELQLSGQSQIAAQAGDFIGFAKSTGRNDTVIPYYLSKNSSDYRWSVWPAPLAGVGQSVLMNQGGNEMRQYPLQAFFADADEDVTTEFVMSDLGTTMTWAVASAHCADQGTRLCSIDEWCPTGPLNPSRVGQVYQNKWWVPVSSFPTYSSIGTTMGGGTAVADGALGLHVVYRGAGFPTNTRVTKFRWQSIASGTLHLYVARLQSGSTYTMIARWDVPFNMSGTSGFNTLNLRSSPFAVLAGDTIAFGWEESSAGLVYMTQNHPGTPLWMWAAYPLAPVRQGDTLQFPFSDGSTTRYYAMQAFYEEPSNNSWVSIGGFPADALCQDFASTHNQSVPPWGADPAPIAARGPVACCGGKFSIVLAPGQTQISSVAEVKFRIYFKERVVHFSVDVVNGVLQSYVAINGEYASFDVTVRSASEGNVSVSIALNSALDFLNQTIPKSAVSPNILFATRPAFVTSPTVASATDTNLSISATMNKTSILYCAVYMGNTSSPTAEDVKSGIGAVQMQKSASASLQAILTFQNLTGGAEYQVFCLASSSTLDMLFPYEFALVMPCQAGAVNTLGHSGCTNCSAGSFSNTSGMTQCVQCSVGFFAAQSGSTLCRPCDLGTYTDKNMTEVCSPCAAGRFAPVAASTRCAACSAGRFVNELGASTCAQCGVGRFADAEGMSECSTCTVGSIAPSKGADHCQKCPIGQFVDQAGATKCFDCPSGTFAKPNECIHCVSKGCLGTDKCAMGYEGNLCGRCSADFFQDKASCQPCTSSSFVAIVLFAVLLVFVIATLVKLNQRETIQRLVQPLKIGVIHLQTIAMFRLLRWTPPTGFSPVAASASLSMLNLQLSRTECFISYGTAFYVILAFPIVVTCVLASWYASLRWFGRHHRTMKQLTAPVRAMITFATFAYAPLTEKALSIFDCEKNGDIYLLRDFRGIRCYSDQWRGYLPVAIGALMVYAIGIPLAMFLLLRRYHFGRAQHSRVVLGFGVMSFRDGVRWWETAQLLWRLCLLIPLRLFADDPARQIVMFASLLSLRALFQAYVAPYTELTYNNEEKLLAMLVLLLMCVHIGWHFTSTHANLSVSVVFSTASVGLAAGVALYIIYHQYLSYRVYRATRQTADSSADAHAQGLEEILLPERDPLMLDTDKASDSYEMDNADVTDIYKTSSSDWDG